jgi:putative FmdB family regulatory protein
MPMYDFECSKCSKTFEVFKHMSEEKEVTCECGGNAVQLICCINTPKDKLYDFVDVHTTGKPIHFTSKKQWESHLKERGQYQLTQGDIKRLKEPPKDKKTNYKALAETAWKERGKFVQGVKYGRIKLNEGR